MPRLLNILNRQRVFPALTLLLICLAYAQTARAQLCPGSQIQLVVRDAQGRILDPTPLSKRAASTRTFDFVKVETINLPDGFGGEEKQAKALAYSDEGCIFGTIEETTFELGGQRMRLVFRNPKRIKDRSVFYAIDSPPFRQGTFEIDLSSQMGLLSDPAQLTSAGGVGRFIFSAAAWQMTSATAPAFPEAHQISLRGTVINDATRLPVAGVKVELLLGELGEEVYTVKGMTDREGHFEINGVPDEKIISSDRVSLSAQPDDFARTQVFINDYKTLAQSEEVLDNIDIALRPLVTVKGHLLETTTGRTANITPGTLEATALIYEQLTKGNYRTFIKHPAKAAITADGTFTMQVAVGRNSFYLADFQNYQTVAPGTRQELIDQFLKFDIKADQQPEIVFRVRRSNP